MIFMRRFYRLVFAVAATAPIALAATAARADPYRWCAVYTGQAGGAQNCGFVTLEQCRATIMGMGGFCTENQFYTGPAERPAKRKRKPSQD